MHPNLLPLSHASDADLTPSPHVDFNVQVEAYPISPEQENLGSILQSRHPACFPLSHYSFFCLIPSPQKFIVHEDFWPKAPMHV
jgi:hypothetical protein